MKTYIYLIALAACVAWSGLLVAMAWKAMLTNGSVTINFNSINEGWVDVALGTIFTGIGVMAVIRLIRKP